MLNFKTCLVTGGCGFIGTALVKKLVKEKIDVYVVDNLATGSKERLKEVDCNLIIADFDNQKILQMIKDKKFDIIFHLAAYPSVKFSVDNPSLTTDTNISSTVRLFEAAIDNVERIIFSSSAAVYGNIHKQTITSTDKKCPITPYAWQKSAIEDVSKIFCNLYNVDIVSLRYFNVYGPDINGSNNTSVIASWLNCIKNNVPLKLEGDGTQSRDYVYIDDIVRANIITANHHEQFNGVAYNISTGESTTNNEIIEYFCDYFAGVKVSRAPIRIGDIKNSLGDSSKINARLNFSTEVCFSEGIAKTFSWHSNKKETK